MLPKRFRVAISEATLKTITAWGMRFRANAVTHRDFLAGLREMNYRLEFEADEWGESRERIETMRLEMRVGTCRMLTVIYGIHEQSRTVIVKRINLHPSFL
jgi:hypothetical protein